MTACPARGISVRGRSNSVQHAGGTFQPGGPLTEMQEQWKDIEGFEGRYQVSDLGRVCSLPRPQRYLLRNGKGAFRNCRGRALAVHPNNGGYLMVKLYRDNTLSTFTVHRLVALAFKPNPDGLPEVNHIDGVKANCCASNLEWQTSSGNKIHAVNIGVGTRAIRVVDPDTREVHLSIKNAAAAKRCRAATIRRTWERV